MTTPSSFRRDPDELRQLTYTRLRRIQRKTQIRLAFGYIILAISTGLAVGFLIALFHH